MDRYDVTTKWHQEIKDKLENVKTKREALLDKVSILYMKINLLSNFKNKLRTDILKDIEKELEETQLEIEKLNNIAHDLSVLETHINLELTKY